MKNGIITSVLFIIFCALCNTSFAQKVNLNKMEQEAVEYYMAKNYYAAIPLLTKLDSIAKPSPQRKYAIAVSYFYIGDNEKAVKFFEQIKANVKELPPTYYYLLGKSHHLSHNFTEAIKNYDIYIKNMEGYNNLSKDEAEHVADTKIEKVHCQNGMELIKTPIDIEIKNMGPKINSIYPDYGPVLTADENQIIFTSNRPNTTGGKMNETDGLYYEDIYISKKVNGEWTEAKQMGAGINTSNDDASISISPDGSTLLIYRFDKSSGDLYFSKLKGTEWGLAEKFNQNINTKAWEPSASINRDGNMLFFVSDKPGGKGKTDIYFSKKLPDGTWDKAQNMVEINTTEEEDCPFIHPDGKTLYFSSKSHKTIGGYDIFFTTYDENTGTWSKPENIGYPINTAHDDMYFAISTDTRRIYFSSIKPGGFGNKDIYFAEIKKEKTAEVVLLSGIVKDSLSDKPIEANIRVNDKTTGNELGNYKSNSSTGAYTIVLNEGILYELNFYADKYGSFSNTIDLRSNSGYKELNQNIKLRVKEKDCFVEVIDKNTKVRISAKVKIKNNENNEQSEKDILPSGAFTIRMKEGNRYTFEANQVGYVLSNTEFVLRQEDYIKDSVKIIIPLAPLKAGEKVIFRNIYFATDEAKCLDNSVPEMDKIIDFLQTNPTTVVEISAHTDDVGNHEYNLKLSENRAKYVTDYLIKKGIATNRLISKGYGENDPVEKGMSDRHRAMNRRVELKVLKLN